MHESMKRSIIVVQSLLLVALLAGCGRGGDNPAAPALEPALAQAPALEPAPAGGARLSFRLAFPEGWNTTQSKILAVGTDGTASPSVAFQLVLFDMTNATTRTLTKVSPIVDRTASATFAALPAWPAVGKVNITGGSFDNASAFAGSLDLVEGNNDMTLLPAVVNATTTVAAFIMEELPKTPAKFAAAPKKLATEVNKVIAGMDFLSPTIRADGLARFLDTIQTAANVTLANGNLACTIIMHGFDPGITGEPAWMEPMQNAIIARSGGAGKKGRLVVTGSKGNLAVTCDPWNFALDTASSGEIVVRVDWSAVANHLLTGVTAQQQRDIKRGVRRARNMGLMA